MNGNKLLDTLWKHACTHAQDEVKIQWHVCLFFRDHFIQVIVFIYRVGYFQFFHRRVEEPQFLYLAPG